jgi:hypothetical protein
VAAGHIEQLQQYGLLALRCERHLVQLPVIVTLRVSRDNQPLLSHGNDMESKEPLIYHKWNMTTASYSYATTITWTTLCVPCMQHHQPTCQAHKALRLNWQKHINSSV